MCFCGVVYITLQKLPTLVALLKVANKSLTLLCDVYFTYSTNTTYNTNIPHAHLLIPYSTYLFIIVDRA